MNYKVFNWKFYSFEEVMLWAEREHGIEQYDIPVTEEEKQEACRELELMIISGPCIVCGCNNCGGCYH